MTAILIRIAVVEPIDLTRNLSLWKTKKNLYKL